MKIILQDQNQFVVKNSISHWFTGFIFLVIGLSIIFKPSFLNINTGIPLWLGLFIVMVGIIPVLFNTRYLIIFNKDENKLKINQKNLVKQKNDTYELSDIKSIELWTISGQNGGSKNNGLQYELACIVENNQYVILNPDTQSSFKISIGLAAWNIIPEKKIGEKIAAFLNIPFVENRRPPTVNETLNVLYDGVRDAVGKHVNQKKLE